MTGQPKIPHHPVAANGAGGPYGVIVKAARHRDTAHRRRQLGDRLLATRRLPYGLQLRLLCEDRPQRLAQLTLRDLPVILLGLPRLVRGW